MKHLTTHANLRLDERSSIHPNEYRKIVDFVIKKGKTAKYFGDSKLAKYMIDKNSNCYVCRAYRGMLFITKNQTIITCYPIPERYLDDYKKYTNKEKQNDNK